MSTRSAIKTASPREIGIVLPKSFDREGLERAGFEGFLTVAALRASRLAAVPAVPGVYVILRLEAGVPHFLATSTGGWFKGQDPSVRLERLTAKWVKGAAVVYIGKAGSQIGSASLRSRIGQLLRFGAGQPVGHWGGRYLWHLPDSDDLVVAWRPSPIPRAEEMELLSAFRRQHGGLPFANLID